MFYFKIAAPPKQIRATHWLEWLPTAVSSSSHCTTDLVVASPSHLLERGLEFLSRTNTLCDGDSTLLRTLSEIIFDWILQRINYLEVIKRGCIALTHTRNPSIMNEFITFMSQCTSTRNISTSSNHSSDSDSDSDIIFALVATRFGGVEGEIHAISKTSSLIWVYDTLRLRSLLLSELSDPWKWLIGLGKEWASWIMELIQMELDVSRPLRAPFDLGASESENIIDFRHEEVYVSPYRRRCLQCLRILSKTFGVLPPSFYVQDVSRESAGAVGGGGFADIWRGRMGRKKVCLKVLRIFTADDTRSEILKEFCEEAVVWKQLNHPNVLPFIGVNKDIFSLSFCFISPWMENGNVIAYLERNPYVDRIPLLSQVANGLQYLHGLDPPIIHGDIRGANILITDDLRCCLADFGLALVTESSRFFSFSDASSPPRGSTRWLAPELLYSNPEPLCEISLPSPARDIYAFGCTAVEIFTGKPPFSEIKYDITVVAEVLQGRTPTIPTELRELGESSESSFSRSLDFWDLIQSCWEYVPSKRPLADDVSQFLAFYVM